MSTIKADVYEDLSAGTQVDSEYVVGGTAKFHCNSNSAGTIQNSDSLNVSSVTDDGTGALTFNYTNNFSDGEHTKTAMAGASAATIAQTPNVTDVTGFEYNSYDDAGTLADFGDNHAMSFGALA